MNFTSCTPIPLFSPSLHIHPLPKATATPKRESFGSYSVSYSIHFCAYIFTCNETLVWFEASGFCYTINVGSSLGFLSDILLVSHVRTSPFTCCSSYRRGRCWGWTNSVLGLGGKDRVLGDWGNVIVHLSFGHRLHVSKGNGTAKGDGRFYLGELLNAMPQALMQFSLSFAWLFETWVSNY